MEYSIRVCNGIFNQSLFGNIPLEYVWKYSSRGCVVIFHQSMYDNIPSEYVWEYCSAVGGVLLELVLVPGVGHEGGEYLVHPHPAAHEQHGLMARSQQLNKSINQLEIKLLNQEKNELWSQQLNKYLIW